MATPLYVDPARADDSGDGTAPATAKKTIAAAYTAVDDGGEVLLLAGTYTLDTQGATWYLGFNAAKSCTIKPDPATAPAITLIPHPTLASINCSAGNDDDTHRVEGLTIVPDAGTRIWTFGASMHGRLEIVDCVLTCGAKDSSYTAATDDPPTRQLYISGCTITTSSPYLVNKPGNFALIEIEDSTITSTSASTSSAEGVILPATCQRVLIHGNTFVAGQQVFVTYSTTEIETLRISDNTLTWTPNAANMHAIYVREDVVSMGVIEVIGNTINVLGTNAPDGVIAIGLDDEISTAAVFTHPLVIGNTLTNANTGYGTAMLFGAGCQNLSVMYNDCDGFSGTIHMWGVWGARIDSNYFEGGTTIINHIGGGRSHITHNHMIAHDYEPALPGRTILYNRLIKATSTTSTTFGVTTVEDTDGAAWGGNQGLIAAPLLALVNAATPAWWLPLQWGRVVSISSNEVTVDAWYKMDGTGDVQTPTNGHVCKIIEFPTECVITDNLMNGRDASFVTTFDFIPIDPRHYSDRNVYSGGTSALTNLASHIVGAVNTLAEFQAAWAAQCPSHADNDANSGVTRPITWGKYWNLHRKARALLTPV